jgi:hypothetical protein
MTADGRQLYRWQMPSMISARSSSTGLFTGVPS